ncbi:MAG: 2Fe-2S iron-sulfur cluster-binding protein [Planctomycetota bacterium]|jgi:formate dehydrogenase major subunit
MTENINVVIDGQAVAAGAGQTVLDAALENGIYVPHLCHHRDLAPVGVCRVCMVEIGGRMVVSCKTPVSEGMVVTTESEDIAKVRQIAAELMIIDNHLDCLTCAKDSECELQRVAHYVNVDKGRIGRMRRKTDPPPVDTSNPFFDRDLAKCILCGICVRTCEEIVGVSAIDYGFRGYDTTISTFGDKPLKESRCVSCGECLARCPVGALIPKEGIKPSREVKTVCTYCGCGCGLYLGVRGDEVVSARGEKENPANRGNLCVKGRFGFDFVNSEDRLTTPLVKRDGKFVETGWDEALDLVAEKLAPHKVMGTNNIDHCARI